MIEYDPKIINKFAEELYKQAQSVVTCYFFMGIFASIIVFGKISDLLKGELDFLIIAIGVFIGAIIGLFAGKNRSFEMKLQAQKALCQVKIQDGLSKKS